MDRSTNNQRITYLRAGAGTSWWAAGDTYTFKLTGDDTNWRFSVYEASVAPLGGLPPHLHHAEHEAYYILEGELDFLDHDRLIRVRAGDFVHVPPGARHSYRNPGMTPGRMLVFISPAGFENFYFEIGQPAWPGKQAPPLGREELLRGIAAASRYKLELEVPAAQQPFGSF